jgi:excisionase family DNA binding protein
MSPPTPLEKPLRLEDAAAFMSVSVKTIRRLIESGKLTAFKIGGQWFTRSCDIQTYIDQQIQKAKGRQPC